jgi:hypothetical protein
LYSESCSGRALCLEFMHVDSMHTLPVMLLEQLLPWPVQPWLSEAVIDTMLCTLWHSNALENDVQNRKTEYELPGLRFPHSVPRNATAAQVLAYLDAFCGKFDLLPHFKFNTPVLRISKCKRSGSADGNASAATDSNGKVGVAAQQAAETPSPRFTVTYKSPEGKEHSEDFTFVILCQGNASGKTNRPEHPGEASFQGKVLHSSQIKSLEQLRGKTVVVVGSGKSSIDLTASASDVAAATTQV